MANQKNFLAPYAVLTAGDMSTATLTSLVTDIRYQDSVCAQAVWSGTTPVGTLDIQGSLDQTTWTSIVSPAAAVTGNTGSLLFDLFALSFPYIRFVYTKTSGTGSLTIKVGAKSLG